MFNKGDYVIVRSSGAGVFAGEFESRDGSEVLLTNARRIHYWAGAASLSELAQRGPSKPGECRFPVAVARVLILGVCEIDTVTPEARAAIAEVPVWSR
jgi:hypothetical protein